MWDSSLVDLLLWLDTGISPCPAESMGRGGSKPWKCHGLIMAGQRLEACLSADGQFLTRPREVLGVINEPFAAGIIYPAVFATWTYVSLLTPFPEFAGLAAAGAFLIGFSTTLSYNLWLKHAGALLYRSRPHQTS